MTYDWGGERERGGRSLGVGGRSERVYGFGKKKREYSERKGEI